MTTPSVEQVFADWTDGPLAHLPSGSFPANAAWLALRRHQPQPAARRRVPGQPRLRQGQRRHPAPRPHRRRRPHRPPRPRPHHPAPARRLAPPDRWMSLFEAACGPPAAGRPDQPRPGHRTPRPTTATGSHPDPRPEPRTSRRNVSGRNATPTGTTRSASQARPRETITRIYAVDRGSGPPGPRRRRRAKPSPRPTTPAGRRNDQPLRQAELQKPEPVRPGAPVLNRA